MSDFELVSFSRAQLRIRHRQGHELIFSIATDVWGRRAVSPGPLIAVYGGPDPAWRIIEAGQDYAEAQARRLGLV
ncbi:hypothetical protein [Ancylobacter lacus]|uniref:hypothetical protein n=1 Tax=Ancylobacter lacus TaxID=2579970 RepID=UPI001BCA7F87|nr:hypothetical protein [Ancylobacter lacus]MBS7539091.1 hypothetical protein [Ancylobacter lacus]